MWEYIQCCAWLGKCRNFFLRRNGNVRKILSTNVGWKTSFYNQKILLDFENSHQNFLKILRFLWGCFFWYFLTSPWPLSANPGNPLPQWENPKQDPKRVFSRKNPEKSIVYISIYFFTLHFPWNRTRLRFRKLAYIFVLSGAFPLKLAYAIDPHRPW